MPGMMVFFHCESNPGFAAARHELTFLELARRIAGDIRDVHFAYPTLEAGISPTLPAELRNFLQFDSESRNGEHLSAVSDYIRKHGIEVAFGFDQPVRRLSHFHMRRAGVRHLVSYWGAPMSSINSGLKLMMKKLDVALARSRPDHFIFQSEGMRDTAVRGRGIPVALTSVVRSGVDTELFRPASEGRGREAHRLLGIPEDRKIVFFSGHMEGRKGVDVILEAAADLVLRQGRSDLHFLILGNKAGQERRFDRLYKGTKTEQYVTFGGYRDDVPKILPSCAIGIVASTGWDSFPMSSIEMAACEVPVVVSDLPGLREAVTPDTGLRFPVGDHLAAAKCIADLADDQGLRRSMGVAGRRRVIEQFSVQQQVIGLEQVVRNVVGGTLMHVT